MTFAASNMNSVHLLEKWKEYFGITWVDILQKEHRHNTMQFDMRDPDVRKELKSQIKLLHMHFCFLLKLSRGVSWIGFLFEQYVCVID